MVTKTNVHRYFWTAIDIYTNTENRDKFKPIVQVQRKNRATRVPFVKKKEKDKINRQRNKAMTTKFKIYETESIENQRSSDYLNLSEPPKPKDTPLGDPRDLRTTYTADPFTGPQALRHRSTNYADALSRRDSSKSSTGLSTFSSYGYSLAAEGNSNSTDLQQQQQQPRSPPRRNMSTQVFQDARHDIQTNKYVDTPPLYRRDSRGNYYCPNPNLNPSSNPVSIPPRQATDFTTDDSVFKQQFREEPGTVVGNEMDDSESRPDMQRRKSSIEYENFKKEVYNRLRLFDQS